MTINNNNNKYESISTAQNKKSSDAPAGIKSFQFLTIRPIVVHALAHWLPAECRVSSTVLVQIYYSIVYILTSNIAHFTT